MKSPCLKRGTAAETRILLYFVCLECDSRVAAEPRYARTHESRKCFHVKRSRSGANKKGGANAPPFETENLSRSVTNPRAPATDIVLAAVLAVAVVEAALANDFATARTFVACVAIVIVVAIPRSGGSTKNAEADDRAGDHA